MANFTDRALSALTLDHGRKDRMIFDAACPGLGLRLTSAGSKVFIVQWTDPATKRKVREKLGVWGGITIEQARSAARARLGEVAKGVNPRAERLRQKEQAERDRMDATLTFDVLINEWAALHLAGRSENYRNEAQRAIRFAFAAMLKRPAARITRADAVNVLDGLVKDGKAAMAAGTLAYARAAFGWAQKRGKVPSNPFQGLPIGAGSKSRDRVLTDAELAAFWTATADMPFPWGPFYRLAALTLQRREEIAGMRWSEISDDFSTWTIPGTRMKNAKPHDVHLPEPARVILRSLPRVAECDLIFSTTGATPVSGFSKAKITLDRAMAAVQSAADGRTGRKQSGLAPWRLHDLRRTGVSTLARLGFDSIVADKLLAHQPAKLYGVAAVYQRHNFAVERARALESWAAHLAGLQGAPNLLPFAKVASK
jgi:integrase